MQTQRITAQPHIPKKINKDSYFRKITSKRSTNHEQTTASDFLWCAVYKYRM